MPASLAPSRLETPSPASTRQTSQLAALAEVGRELLLGREGHDSLERALAVLDRRLAARRSLLCRADSERRALEVEGAHGLGAELFRPRFGQGVVGRVADSGRPIVVPVVHHEPMALVELVDPQAWNDERWGLVCVPVAIAGRPSGVLSAYFPASERVELGAQLGVLEVAASLMAQAFRGAQEPYREALAPREDLRQRSERALFEYSNMVGASGTMRQVYEQVGQVARTSATALIRGESGTGKELVAHAIHQNSPRARGPFVKVNCAALPETLFESELFGHERGAFTGAHSRKKGRFELAHGGTLFLDEIGELPLATQVKLLRALQSREFERLGGTETLRSDVRIVAATNKDMERAVAAGVFREDLYYRLNVFTITLPSLRERGADVPALAEYFLQKYATEHRRRITRIASGALDLLTAYDWPGNVRELENAIERAVVVCDGVVLQEGHLPKTVGAPSASKARTPRTLGEAVAELERTMIEEALVNARGNGARAARALGTTERIVRYKAGKYGIDPSRFR